VSKLIGLYVVASLLLLSLLCRANDSGSFFHISKNDGGKLKGVHKLGTSEIGKYGILNIVAKKSTFIKFLQWGFVLMTMLEDSVCIVSKHA